MLKISFQPEIASPFPLKPPIPLPLLRFHLPARDDSDCAALKYHDFFFFFFFF